MLFILIRTVITVAASIIFLYFYWKKLKDDYSQVQIFSSGFYILFGVAIGFIVSRVYLPYFWFWLSLLGAFLGFLLGLYRYKMRFFEGLEAFSIALMNLLFIEELFQFATAPSFDIAIKIIAVLALIFIFFYISRRYKKYVWYRSGRVGFSGLTMTGFYFVFRASFLIFSGIMNKNLMIDAIASTLLAFASFLALFNLSKKEI